MITFKNVFYSYESKAILRNISLSIKEGECVILLGHNGSGKTTIIKHLNGLLLPKKGEVSIDSLSTRTNAEQIRKKVGIVFQNPEDQLVHSIVEEDVAFGLENLGIPSETMRREVSAILKKLNIYHLAKENVNNLSFGQKQLVALAGILVMKPGYIVFDEPSSWLDPKNKANLFSLLQELHNEGKTIILITNNLADIRKLGDRIILLKDGSIIFDGKKSDLTSSLLKQAGMDGE
jgi:energy-coupling factor transport system ATP-binding protein